MAIKRMLDYTMSEYLKAEWTPYALAGHPLPDELKKTLDNENDCRQNGVTGSANALPGIQITNTERKHGMSNLAVKLHFIQSLDATWNDNKERTDAQLFDAAQRLISGEY